MNPPDQAQNGMSCWVVSDGKIGIDNQCIGLAEAVELQPILKHVSLRSPWRLVFPIVTHLHPHAFRPGEALAPPWPDVLITGGRSGAAVSLFVKRASGGQTVTVHIQNPHINAKRFDVLIAGDHDGISGSNILPVRGALNRVTPAKLADSAARFPDLAALPQPRIAVVLGGANRCYQFGPEQAAALGEQLAALQATGVSLMITASRRTGAEQLEAIRSRLLPRNCFIWDGMGENPYFALLGLADHILVTCDSISMISEAGVTGKPVHVIELPGGDAKFRQFHASMRQAGVTRPFTGTLDHWSYEPLNDTERAAGLVKSVLSRT